MYAEENSLLFMETSAKTAMNVNDIFLAIGEPAPLDPGEGLGMLPSCPFLFLAVPLPPLQLRNFPRAPQHSSGQAALVGGVSHTSETKNLGKHR